MGEEYFLTYTRKLVFVKFGKNEGLFVILLLRTTIRLIWSDQLGKGSNDVLMVRLYQEVIIIIKQPCLEYSIYFQ